MQFSNFVLYCSQAKLYDVHVPDGLQRRRKEFRMKKVYSSPSLFGGMNYYDEAGHQIGYSTEGVFGGQNFYDESGHHVGYSTDGLFGGENFYSDKNGYVGYSTEGLFGGHNYHGDGMNGYSVDRLFGGEVGFFDDYKESDW